jgi:hypothetical protein
MRKSVSMGNITQLAERSGNWMEEGYSSNRSMSRSEMTGFFSSFFWIVVALFVLPNLLAMLDPKRQNCWRLSCYAKRTGNRPLDFQ